jgi:hypothetical protein
MGYNMGDPVQRAVDEQVLKDIRAKVLRIVEPTVMYNPNTEAFLKGVIADQQDIAAEIDSILTNILFC